MPSLAGTVTSLIQKRAFDDQTRTLILLEKKSGRAVWGKFVHRYDASSRGPVELFFDATWRSLSVAEENSVFTAEVLPILKLLPNHHIVIVEHGESGCKVLSGDPSDVSDLMGLE